MYKEKESLDIKIRTLKSILLSGDGRRESESFSILLNSLQILFYIYSSKIPKITRFQNIPFDHQIELQNSPSPTKIKKQCYYLTLLYSISSKKEQMKNVS